MRPFAAACLLCAALGASSQAGPERPAAASVPAFLGETLRYDMTILGMEAGEVVLSAASDEYEGRPAYRLEMTIATNDVFSKIFPVHDSLRSWVDAATLASLCFHKHTIEGRRVREETITFDQERAVAVRGDKPILFTPPAFDSLSSVFFVRTLPLEGPGPISLAVVSKDAFALQVELQGRQTVTTPAGTFRAIRVEPKSPGDNLIGKGRNLVLWLTDDERRLPVQMRSALAFGTLVGKLKSIERTEPLTAGR
jgi:Protein of unknown function (DUF3108)